MCVCACVCAPSQDTEDEARDESSVILPLCFRAVSEVQEMVKDSILLGTEMQPKT